MDAEQVLLLEAAMEEEFALTGNLEEGTRLEISFEETGITLEIASQETGAIVMETAMVQETFSSVLEEKPIETLKEEMVAMVQEEEMSFMEVMEELAPPPPPMELIEEMKEERLVMQNPDLAERMPPKKNDNPMAAMQARTFDPSKSEVLGVLKSVELVGAPQ